MQPPPRGAQILQLSLQQYSSAPQTTAPQCSPRGGFGGQNSRVQPAPSGTQRLQLSLQQYSPGPQIASLQTSPPQRSSEQGVPAGTHSPPQFGQQMVPSRQSIAAQGLTSPPSGTQKPEQSAPAGVGPQLSGSWTQVYPPGQTIPAIPPQIMSLSMVCAAVNLRDPSNATPPANAASTPRRGRRLPRFRVHRSNSRPSNTSLLCSL